ncbi:MAG: hypothetical protein K6G78_04625 [bacterium]|nr:hypothetical protein [bacterium]
MKTLWKSLVVCMLAALTALALAACGSSGSGGGSGSGGNGGGSAPAGNSPNEQTQTIGNSDVGHVTIPASWVEFDDVDVDDDAGIIQYCGDPSTIITLSAGPASNAGDLTGFNSASEKIANVIYADMVDEVGEENVEGASVTLAGQQAYQVYGAYPDGTFLVNWVLEDSAGNVHFVSAEGTADTIEEAVGYVEGSYTFN